MDDTTRSHSANAQFPDAAFAVLRNRRRRHVVSFLAERESQVSVSELAAEVREREREADSETAGRADAVAVTLHHNHLPKLADVGALVYDPETKTVTPRYVEPFASVLRTTDDARPESGETDDDY